MNARSILVKGKVVKKKKKNKISPEPYKGPKNKELNMEDNMGLSQR